MTPGQERLQNLRSSGQKENADLLVQKVLRIQGGDSGYLDGEGARGSFRLS